MAQQLALLQALGADRSYAERGAEILKLFAKHIKSLPVQGDSTQTVIWTYNDDPAQRSRVMALDWRKSFAFMTAK